MNLIFLCVATYARFCHGGKVCSGDYLYSGKDSDVELTGYTNIEGVFLQVYCIACWVKFAVVFVIIGMVI